jgi:hypothetical protein
LQLVLGLVAVISVGFSLHFRRPRRKVADWFPHPVCFLCKRANVRTGEILVEAPQNEEPKTFHPITWRNAKPFRISQFLRFRGFAQSPGRYSKHQKYSVFQTIKQVSDGIFIFDENLTVSFSSPDKSARMQHDKVAKKDRLVGTRDRKPEAGSLLRM